MGGGKCVRGMDYDLRSIFLTLVARLTLGAVFGL